MGEQLTKRQMINVELAARAGNKKYEKVLKSHIPAEEQKDLKILFNCECSDPTCKERTPLTLKEYDRLHSNYAHFIVVKGHVEPRVEKIHKKGKDVSVVERYALK